MTMTVYSSMPSTHPIKEDVEYDSDGAVIEDDDGDDEEEEEEEDYDNLELPGRSSALVDKKRGFGKHKHPWLKNKGDNHFEEENDENFSVSGMISEGDVSTSTKSSHQPPVGQFMRRGSSVSGKTIKSEKRKEANRLKQLEEDEEGATPMLPPKRKHIPNIRAATAADRQQVAGEASSGGGGGTTLMTLPEDAVYTQAVMQSIDFNDDSDGIYNTTATDHQSDGIWLQPTQKLHMTPPPGMAVRASVTKTFWSNICPC